MSFQLTTNRLQLQIEDSASAQKILDFYKKNATLFDKYEPTRPDNFYTLAYQEKAITYEYSEIMKGKSLRYYVYLKGAPSIIIGSVNFSRIEHGPFSRTSIGYKFDSEYQGKGYALEACQATIPILFSNYHIHRIEARVALDNFPSIRLLEKLNFVYEGIEYKSVEVNNVFRDHHRYSLINPAIHD